MPTVTLNADSRNELGKGAARKIRATGQLPAVIYRGGEPALSVSIDPAKLELAFQKTNNRNTLVDLQIDGGSRLCLVRATQRDPANRLLVHVDFFEVRKEEMVTVEVPVRPIGEAPGMTIGGALQRFRRTLDITCLPADIPEKISVDISELEIGDFIRVFDVPPPKGCKITAPTNFNVIGVVGRRGASYEDEVAAEVAEVAEVAEPDGA